MSTVNNESVINVNNDPVRHLLIALIVISPPVSCPTPSAVCCACGAEASAMIARRATVIAEKERLCHPKIII
jgi:hypothetical protein